MKVVLLNGSPRGENSSSLRLAQAFLRGMGCEDARVHPIAALDISPCKGCFGCWKNGRGACVLQDDMQAVFSDLIAADIVLWSFPLYYYSVPGILKNVIDRQLPTLLPFMEDRADGLGNGAHPARYDLSRQRHVLISTCGFYTAQGNYDSVHAMFDHICGKGKYTAIECGQGELFRVPQLKKRTDEYLSFVEAAGREFVAGGITAPTREKLGQLLYPKAVYEEMSDSSWGVERSGEKPRDNSLAFTRQMAALYNKGAHSGKDRVLEFHYTDVDKTYQIHLEKDGHRVEVGSSRPYTTRIETPLSVWVDISEGKMTGQEAMMQHRYRVLGDFDLMLRWDEYFSGGLASGDEGIRPPAEGTRQEKKPQMALLIAPWMTIWIFLAIHPVWGAAAGIAVASCVPLLWLKWKPTVYEYLTVFAVNAVCLLSLLGVSTLLLLPASYLVFGILWGVTVFMKVPLSACYSQNAYGGEKALRNPLFIKTNRILTACWAILYLVTPIWTYLLMKTALSPYIGAINSIFPALLGAFTWWFQRWYPANYARG